MVLTVSTMGPLSADPDQRATGPAGFHVERGADPVRRGTLHPVSRGGLVAGPPIIDAHGALEGIL